MTCEEEPREREVSEAGLKAVNREGPTGPPNNTKEAPQLFGGNTSPYETHCLLPEETVSFKCNYNLPI